MVRFDGARFGASRDLKQAVSGHHSFGKCRFWGMPVSVSADLGARFVAGDRARFTSSLPRIGVSIYRFEEYVPPSRWPLRQPLENRGYSAPDLPIGS